MSNDGNISDNPQDLLESSRRTHRRLFAAGRLAGLREAAEVANLAEQDAQARAEAWKDDYSNYTTQDGLYDRADEASSIAKAILALAERGEG